MLLTDGHPITHYHSLLLINGHLLLFIITHKWPPSHYHSLSLVVAHTVFLFLTLEGDFVPTDEIYREIEKERIARSEEVMELEAKTLASLFTENNQ